MVGDPEFTVADVERRIRDRALLFSQHSLLKRLENPGVLAEAHAMAKSVTFFVFCFQDMLRLVRERVSDPQIKAEARVHELEDNGHEAWFLNDLEHFGIVPHIGWVFGPQHQGARDTSYELVTEILRAPDDWSRLSIVLVLEAAATECFGRAVGFIDRLGEAGSLKYFAGLHQRAEQAHEMFDPKKRSPLFNAVLSRAAFQNCCATVDKTFSLMAHFADHVEKSMRDVPQTVAGVTLAG
jgi:hypothetical protein